MRERRQQACGVPSRAPSGRRLTWFDRWERHLWAIDDTLRDLARGLAGLTKLQALVDHQQMLVAAQPDAALFTLMRQDDRRFALYALTHAYAAAAVVQLTAAILGWPAEQAGAGVAAALTMNASIVELQARMAEQRDPPSKKQLERLREHPAQSAQMLRACGVTDAASPDVSPYLSWKGSAGVFCWLQGHRGVNWFQ